MNAQTSLDQPRLGQMPVWVQGRLGRICSGTVFLDLDMEKSGSIDWHGGAGLRRCLLGEPIPLTFTYHVCQERLETWEAVAAGNATSISQQLEQDLEHLRRRVEAGDVCGARQLLREIVAQHGTPVDVMRWHRVLSEPRAIVKQESSGGGLRENAAWMRDHADEFRGQWLALKRGDLLDSDPRLADLHRRIESSGDLDSVVFVRIPG
jgi:hypothetical protein